ncbi:metallophosphoesterase [Streptomyces albus]|uniref:Metallophosphoesterase n=2 Tax=Streptomyces TaxID=1883 RepID=A0A0B5EXH8_STRA4|nr:metallophosphoesterase [Streptomyces albus]AOU80828.1 metallophosphoesterase [Streptomyces albus]AYN36532.1 metallophosphoesterase [Streptomyces albus]
MLIHALPRAALALTALGALAVLPGGSAAAQQEAAAPAATGRAPEPVPRTAEEMLRPVAPPPASTLDTGAGAAGPGATSISDGDGLELGHRSRPVAPGVTMDAYDRLESDKWLRVHSLSVDLGGGTKVDYLDSGKVAGRKTLSELAAGHDPGKGRRTVAAINGDFFDLNGTQAPAGSGLRGGKFVKSPAEKNNRVVGVGPADAGRILELYFDGTLTLPDGKHALGALNTADVPAGGIGAYNSQWGEADRKLTVDGGERATEVSVVDGKVTAVGDKPGKGAIPEGTTVLLGSDAGADTLAGLKVGDKVSLEYSPRTDKGEVPGTAIGGRELLVVDGEPVDHEGGGNNANAARTAVGFSEDGSKMTVLTVDGWQTDSVGVTLTELGLMMKRAGVHNALNLDGGGSTALLARTPGSDEIPLQNSPSDGRERDVPNGLAFTAPEGSGKVEDYWVETAMKATDAATVDQVKGGHPERVFPGLTRELTASAYDETYGPADATPKWTSSDTKVGEVDAKGVFTAGHGGTAKVTAASGSASGDVELTVLDKLDRIQPSTRRVGIGSAEESGHFGLVGLDAHGGSAPIEPADATLDYDHDLFSITPDDRGGFTVKAKDGSEEQLSGQVTAEVGGKSTVLAVTVGLTEQQEADFDDAESWKFSQARADGSLKPTPEGHDGTGLEMTYDFTKSNATRAAYATPPKTIPVAGQPQSFGLWIKGDGKGTWPTLHLKDAAGADQLLRGPFVDWTGWKKIEFKVPAGTNYPVSVHRFYVAETIASRQYAGKVTFDDLTAEVPPDVDLPAQPVAKDPLISTAAGADGRDWRFAVMSDAQFVAKDPDSPVVAQARRTLKEIKAARPDFLVVNGDLVDEGSPEDLAFAHKILDEELGEDLPWYYVPGNHEVMGGKIDNFTEEFGAPQRTFDHKGTRFITLDTSSLTLRGGGYEQIKELRGQLDKAAKDPDIGSVMVVEHVPPRDPTPQQGSQLNSRKEAAMLENWLTGFRLSTGKGAGFIGSHVGTFHASHVDGVPYLVNGNSGKAPATAPDRGGFTGWSMVGVDPVPAGQQEDTRNRPWAGGPDWLSVQTRAHVDGLALSAPDQLPAGKAESVTATVTQGEGEEAREVPVGFPLSADWSGSAKLYVGDPDDAGPADVAAYDPATGKLTGLRPGKATVQVTVNGTAEEASFTVS